MMTFQKEDTEEEDIENLLPASTFFNNSSLLKRNIVVWLFYKEFDSVVKCSLYLWVLFLLLYRTESVLFVYKSTICYCMFNIIEWFSLVLCYIPKLFGCSSPSNFKGIVSFVFKQIVPSLLPKERSISWYSTAFLFSLSCLYSNNIWVIYQNWWIWYRKCWWILCIEGTDDGWDDDEEDLLCVFS